MILASFIGCLLAFLAIGLLSALRSRGTRKDYYLASHDVAPWLVGLSAVATNNSGYMFIGVIGYTYTTGLAAIWLMFGWILGDFLASLFIHKKLRLATTRVDEATYGGILSQWNNGNFRIYRRVGAIVTIMFLGAYAAAQFSAGGKAVQGLFGWEPQTGAILVALIVVFYCLAGGIRASIWTDAAQSFVMLAAMLVLCVAAVFGMGGLDGAWQKMAAIPDYTNWFPSDLLVPGATGMALFVVGWMFAGFSVIGQPHIMVRFMALDKPERMTEARVYYYGFFIIFYALATAVGMLSKLYLPDLHALDPELALPTIAKELLPPPLVGLILAGIFAATMSTADSLVLSCSAAVTHDLLPKRMEKNWQIKVATVGVTALALVIALNQTESVFALVIMAWAVLASAFGPLIAVYALGGKPSERHALLMMAVGVIVVLVWRQLGWNEMIYEGMPGILAGLASYYIPRMFHREPQTAPAEENT